MVLRCSLLGHDYGETDVEREREERGSEVVVTVQEYEECVRCGERNVISENTEITSLSIQTDADSRPTKEEPEPETTATADTEAVETPPETAVETGVDTEVVNGGDNEDDAEFIDAEAEDDAVEFVHDETEADPADPASTSTVADAPANGDNDGFDVPTDEHGEPVTDDGEILEDDDEPEPDRDREHGEWPASEDVGPPVGAEAEPAGWPDDESERDESDPVTDAETERKDADVTDDAVVLEDDGDGTTDGVMGESTAAADARTVTTEPPATDTKQDADAESQPDAGAGTGIERAGSAPAPGESGGTPREGVPTEFYCPQCGYVAAGDRGSLRTGDICPDCRKGYLSERERR
ncbi:DUF7093 family protein [Natronorubrum thiooxidans]|uniref:Uncharacterized protein n=1 Tax=Natronorubrum thiooxidans TaxID=308853 RepID=A0A1N7FB10_9EURY|nr:hypothetical protein [Natronorubrum thiooxidans]SIR97578.1 hypothetical protein SAMN05421752_106157 [Natronorubrum thiooxidans]